MPVVRVPHCLSIRSLSIRRGAKGDHKGDQKTQGQD